MVADDEDWNETNELVRITCTPPSFAVNLGATGFRLKLSLSYFTR